MEKKKRITIWGTESFGNIDDLLINNNNNNEFFKKWILLHALSMLLGCMYVFSDICIKTSISLNVYKNALEDTIQWRRKKYSKNGKGRTTNSTSLFKWLGWKVSFATPWLLDSWICPNCKMSEMKYTLRFYVNEYSYI